MSKVKVRRTANGIYFHRERRREERFEKYRQTLEYQLCEALQSRAGERGDNEGAVDCLYRIIHERDQALLILALDRLRDQRSRELSPQKNINPKCYLR